MLVCMDLYAPHIGEPQGVSPLKCLLVYRELSLNHEDEDTSAFTPRNVLACMVGFQGHHRQPRCLMDPQWSVPILGTNHQLYAVLWNDDSTLVVPRLNVGCVRNDPDLQELNRFSV